MVRKELHTQKENGCTGISYFYAARNTARTDNNEEECERALYGLVCSLMSSLLLL